MVQLVVVVSFHPLSLYLDSAYLDSAQEHLFDTKGHKIGLNGILMLWFWKPQGVSSILLIQ